MSVLRCSSRVKDECEGKGCPDRPPVERPDNLIRQPRTRGVSQGNGPRVALRLDTCCPRRRLRAATRKTKQLMNFSDLGLAAPILKALQDEGYQEPTAIQGKAIPIALAGRDLLGIAQTGTGKTAAFALPIIHRLAADRRPPMRKGCRVLVLSPTRELATQIAESFRTYGRYLGLTVTVVFGGVGHRPQTQALARGVDVLVATPGRLLDHIAERNINLAGTEIFVLDEADQMLDLGFLPPIRRIVSQLSARRQNLFFSATMPPEIGKLAGELLRDPVRVAVTPVGIDRRQRHATRHSRRKPPEARVAGGAVCRPEDVACPRLHAHQARRRPCRPPPRGRGHSRRRHPRQQEPVSARERTGGVSRCENPGPGRNRHRRSRHRHRRCDACRELRAAGRAGELRASHRPHGTRPGPWAWPSRCATRTSATSFAASSA